MRFADWTWSNGISWTIFPSLYSSTLRLVTTTASLRCPAWLFASPLPCAATPSTFGMNNTATSPGIAPLFLLPNSSTTPISLRVVWSVTTILGGLALARKLLRDVRMGSEASFLFSVDDSHDVSPDSTPRPFFTFEGSAPPPRVFAAASRDCSARNNSAAASAASSTNPFAALASVRRASQYVGLVGAGPREMVRPAPTPGWLEAPGSVVCPRYWNSPLFSSASHTKTSEHNTTVPSIHSPFTSPPVLLGSGASNAISSFLNVRPALTSSKPLGADFNPSWREARRSAASAARRVSLSCFATVVMDFKASSILAWLGWFLGVCFFSSRSSNSYLGTLWMGMMR
mmetsp:Transcript_4392/g.7858  ORF Transcript_4392/g.7858 Transcript_4392/m.7858 type:complete len:343 (+) Transcript_4392:513-1541(+)